MGDLDVAAMEVFEKGQTVIAKNKVKINGYGNLRAYLQELHDFLFENDFVDTLEPGIDTARPKSKGGGNVMLKPGEFADTGEYCNRNADMYEWEFRDVDLGGGAKEYEVQWKAIGPLKLSFFGKSRFHLTFKVVIRRCLTKEFEENGKTVEKQGGMWEFECKYTHINKDLDKRLKNIPVIGKWNWTKELLFKKIYKKYVMKDVIDSITMTGKIRGIAVKYFSMHGNK